MDNKKRKRASASKGVKKRRVTKSLVNPPRPSFVRPEQKADDNTSITTAVGATVTWSAAQLLTTIDQGPGDNQRVGRKARLTSFMINTTAQLAATSTLGGSVRYKIVYDKQSSGAAPAITDILVSDSFYSLNNIDNGQRFITLMDWTEDISASNSFCVSNAKYRKLNLPIAFISTGSAIADISSGAIYLFASSSGTIGVAQPTFSYYSRVRYTDA